MRLISSCKLTLLILAVVALARCASISDYDAVSYQHLTALKVDTLALMDKATDPFLTHRKDIDDVTLELDKAYEYDKGRPLNSISTQMWEHLRVMFENFLTEWKRKGSLNYTTIQDFKEGAHGTGISEGFDQMIQLESGKKQ